MIRYIDDGANGDVAADWHVDFEPFAPTNRMFRRSGGAFGDGRRFRGGGPFAGRARGEGRSPFGEAERGSIKYEILGILWDGPRHGYDIMRTIETLRGYRPSPGSVYPALQMLEEGDFLIGREIDGKRVYTITEKGSKLLAEHHEAVDGAPARDATDHVALMHRGMHTLVGLKTVLKEIGRTRDADLYAKAIAILDTTRRQLYDLLTQD